MTSDALERLLDRLEESKRRFGARPRIRTQRLLALLGQRRFTDAQSLIRFHEILLFLRAYPQTPNILRQVENALSSFERRVELLRSAGADLSPLEEVEVSGIAGTSLTAVFSYHIVRWMVRHHPAKVAIDWEGYTNEARLGATLPRFLPLLEEDALVEANVPYLTWLHVAQGRSNRDLPWLLQRFEGLSLSDEEKAELYDSLNLWIHLRISSYQISRTGMRRRGRKIFYHDGPLLRRSDISVVKELESPLSLKKLSPAQGESILDMARAASMVRYRELYGFTHGDSRHVLRADAGRGVEIFVSGVGPEHRLPLRAYHAGFIIKNGVPVGYVECLTMFERMEAGFNLYYTFRDGETAWLYARILRLFRQMLGVTSFSVDPYQIGFENEEGIESGAFWFYRKMGFRPAQVKLAKIVEAEERKIAHRTGYRTSARVLRQLSAGHLIFEFPPSSHSDWGRFQIRNLGLAVQRRMAKHFGGQAEKIRHASVESVSRALGARTAEWREAERRAFENLALVMALIPGLARWTKDEKSSIARLVRAKAGAEESRYVRMLQNHTKLRSAILKLGS